MSKPTQVRCSPPWARQAQPRSALRGRWLPLPLNYFKLGTLYRFGVLIDVFFGFFEGILASVA